MKTPVDLNNKTILVTGSPGFIGANLVIRLLRKLTGGTVVSLDNINDYYDPMLKEYRLGLIERAGESSPVKHVFIKGSIADKALVDFLFQIRRQLIDSINKCVLQVRRTIKPGLIYLRITDLKHRTL